MRIKWRNVIIAVILLVGLPLAVWQREALVGLPGAAWEKARAVRLPELPGLGLPKPPGQGELHPLELASPTPAAGTRMPEPTPWPAGKPIVVDGLSWFATPETTPTPRVHVVQAGDTLAKIAKQYGTTVQAVVEANKDRYPSLETDPGRLVVGWELVIP